VTPSSAPPGKGVGIIIALIVFVILLFVVIGKNDKNMKVGVKELKVEKVDKDSVDKIEVTLAPKKDAPDAGPAAAPPSRVVLEKSGTAWKVFDPMAADKKLPVDEGQIKSALDAIGEFATGDLIANKKEKHADLEIDDAKGHVVKIYAKGDKVLDLVFGRPAKGGGSTVRLAGSDDVYVAKGRLGSTLKKEIGAWRKKALFDLKAGDITRVAITAADGSKLTFVSVAPPQPPPDAGPVAPKVEWSLVEPAALPASFRLDKAQLSRPASTIATLRAQDFADGASDAMAGFDVPHAIIEATAADGKKIALHIGQEDDKKRVHAKVDGDPQVYLLASYSGKQLQKSLDDLRELTLLDAKIEDVEKVTFKGSGSTVVVKKEGAEWKLVEPKTPPADFDATQIPSQLAGLLRTRATRVAMVSPADAFAGHDPMVEVQMAGGRKQVLRFGSALPLEDDAKPKDAKGGAVEPREFYVKGSVDDLAYVIAAFTRNRYDKPSEIFKKPPALPPGMGGAGGGIPGMENLPPDIRKKLEESMKKGELPSGHP
jgi:hypothetical protein